MLLVTNSAQASLATLSSLTLPCLSCPPQHTQLHTATCCPAHNSTPQHIALHCLATVSQMHLSEGPNNAPSFKEPCPQGEGTEPAIYEEVPKWHQLEKSPPNEPKPQ